MTRKRLHNWDIWSSKGESRWRWKVPLVRGGSGVSEGDMLHCIFEVNDGENVQDLLLDFVLQD